METEIWKNVVGFEGSHMVSNMGRVLSVGRAYVRVDGRNDYYKETIMSPFLCRNGYLNLKLRRNGDRASVLVHRLVAMAFISNDSLLREVNHINGVKKDNRVENLEWCESFENKRHAWGKGLYTHSGAKHYLAVGVTNKVTGEVFGSIKEAYNSEDFGIKLHQFYKRLKSGLTNFSTI